MLSLCWCPSGEAYPFIMALKKHYDLQSTHYSPSWAGWFEGIPVNSPVLKVWAGSWHQWSLLLLASFDSRAPGTCHWAGTVQIWNKQSFFLTFFILPTPSKLCFKQAKLQLASLKAVELLICSEVLKSFAVTSFSTVSVEGQRCLAHSRKLHLY